MHAGGEIESYPKNGHYQIDINQPVNRDVTTADLDPADATVTTLTATTVNTADVTATNSLTDPGGTTPRVGLEADDHNHSGETLGGSSPLTSISSQEVSIGGWSGAKSLNQSNFGNFTEHIGYQVSIPATSYYEMFSVSEPVDVVTGTIVGNVARNMDVTWADGTTSNFYNGTARGRDSGGDAVSFNPVPPLEDITSLSFRNSSPTADEYGYKVITV